MGADTETHRQTVDGAQGALPKREGRIVGPRAVDDLGHVEFEKNRSRSNNIYIGFCLMINRKKDYCWLLISLMI